MSGVPFHLGLLGFMFDACPPIELDAPHDPRIEALALRQDTVGIHYSGELLDFFDRRELCERRSVPDRLRCP